MKLMGKADMRDLMRLALINIYDVMEEIFDNELLKAGISFDAVLRTHMGPDRLISLQLFVSDWRYFWVQGSNICWVK